MKKKKLWTALDILIILVTMKSYNCTMFFFYYCEYCTLLSILIHNDNWSYYRQQQHSSDNEDEKQEKGVYCKINELLFLP
jgi:hypothetical protein